MSATAVVSNKIGQRLGPRGRRTRERLLDAARTLLDTRSPIDLTASAIARAADASAASFYVYFDDVSEALLMLSAAAAPSVEAMFPRADSLLVDARLETDVAIMIGAVNAAWDRDAPVLLYRNLEADRGDARFDSQRFAQTAPMRTRIAEAISARRGADADRIAATAEAGVLVAAIERIAVHTHRPRTEGPRAVDLEKALVKLVLKGIR